MNTDNTINTTPKDFFMWVAAIIALYISVGSFIALVFSIVDRLFTVGVTSYHPYSGGMSFAIASLIIIFPIYILLTRANNQDVRAHDQKRNLWVHKWGIYLTLFLSASGMLIDLITLVYTFLRGEQMTVEFIVKVLVVLVVFGAVFYYYNKDIKGYWQKNESKSKVIGASVAAVVLVSLISGFFVMGSPSTQRKIKNDRVRISDLQSIQYSIINYYRSKQELPESLEALTDPLEGIGYTPVDPESGLKYGYNLIASEGPEPKFELCAKFSLESPKVDEGALSGGYDDWQVRELMKEATQWGHGVGDTCYERTIDPDKYEEYPRIKSLPTPIRID